MNGSGMPQRRQDFVTFKEVLAERLAHDREFARLWEERRPLRELQQTIIIARCDAGLSQSEFARRLGVSRPVVSRLESGDNWPRLETLQRVANVLGIRLTVNVEPMLEAA